MAAKGFVPGVSRERSPSVGAREIGKKLHEAVDDATVHRAPATASVAEEAYDRHRAWLIRWVTGRTRDPVGASDFVQEAFLRLVRETELGRPPRDVGPWLRQVAANLIASRGRHEGVRRRWVITRSPELATSPSPEELVIRREEEERVLAAVELLGADARASLHLAALGYSSREIAAAIGRNEGATRTLICRTRSRIRNELVPT
jgi:RNA polymerase sigma-70 factor (ECF subfamily)